MSEDDDDRFYDLRQEICRVEIEAGDQIRTLLKPLPDQDVLALADDFERRAGGPNHRGYRMHRWDDHAQHFRAEVGRRRILSEAVASGLPVYCPVCKGACESEEQHDVNAREMFGVKTRVELDVGELSLTELQADAVLLRRLAPALVRLQDALKEGGEIRVCPCCIALHGDHAEDLNEGAAWSACPLGEVLERGARIDLSVFEGSEK